MPEKTHQDPSEPDRLITAKDVKALLGDISEMSLWRWQNDPNLGFPKPLKIRKLRFWRERDICAFIEKQAREAA